MANPEKTKPVVLTIGHSTRPREDLIHLLQVHAVKKVVDVCRGCPMALPPFVDW